MTRRFAVAAAALIALAVPTAAQAQNNETIFNKVFDQVWNTGSFDGVEAILAPDARFHFGGRTSPLSMQRFQGMVSSWRTAFPDLQFQIQEVVSGGDRVAAVMTFTGTHRGAMFGVEPAGATVNVPIWAMLQIVDGRITDMWEIYDHAGLMQQLQPRESN